MLRLFQWMIMILFGLMLWRTLRNMGGGRTPRRSKGSAFDPPTPNQPAQKFNDTKDADFVDLKPTDKDKKSDSDQ